MPSAERTLVLMKPDTLKRGLCGQILSRYERAGLTVVMIRQARLSRGLLSRHYAELRQQKPEIYRRNAPYLTGKTVVAVVLEGLNAVAKARALTGPTDPLEAPVGTVRGDFGSDSISAADAEKRGLMNLVHAADSVASARREMRLWFPRAFAG